MLQGFRGETKSTEGTKKTACCGIIEEWHLRFRLHEIAQNKHEQKQRYACKRVTLKSRTLKMRNFFNAMSNLGNCEMGFSACHSH